MVKLAHIKDFLAEIIIRYHDAHVTSSELCVKFTDATHLPNQFKETSRTIESSRLEALIHRCTSHYPARKDLLLYLLQEINFIELIVARKTSFSASELVFYKNQLAALFIDIRTLLLTKKSELYSVHISQTIGAEGTTVLVLNGLIKDGYFDVGHFCDSGAMLDELLMKRLGLSISSTNEEIKDLADELCDNQQNCLLAAERMEFERLFLEEKARSMALEAENKVLTARIKASEPPNPMLLHLVYPGLFARAPRPKEAPAEKKHEEPLLTISTAGL